jgi:hypothetical protein
LASPDTAGFETIHTSPRRVHTARLPSGRRGQAAHFEDHVFGHGQRDEPVEVVFFFGLGLHDFQPLGGRGGLLAAAAHGFARFALDLGAGRQRTGQQHAGGQQGPAEGTVKSRVYVHES